MRKTLFGRLRAGPRGRTIEEPGIVPAWLQVSAAGLMAVGALVLLGYLLLRQVML